MARISWLKIGRVLLDQPRAGKNKDLAKSRGSETKSGKTELGAKS